MNASTPRAGKSLLLSGVASLLVAAALPAAAATFSVTSTADTVDANLADGVCADANGVCTLRAAIMQANAIGGANTIDLSQIADPSNPIILSLAGVDESWSGDATNGYVVTSAHDASKGDLNITSSMNIVGAGSDKTIIEWSPAAAAADRDRVFHIEATASNITVTISGVTIENGVTPPAELVKDNLDGTVYQFERWGGGIAIGPAAAVTLVKTTSGSDSGSGGSGGGGGSGGSDEGESSAVISGVTLSDVRVLNNVSGTAGGGIANAAPLTLDNVIVSGNSGATNGGGIYNDAQLTIRSSTIGTTAVFTTPNSAEGGGGIFDTGMHNTYISASAINGNTGVGGGGISARSLVTMTILNTTIANNQATDVGGGITTNGQVTLQNDTIAGNSAANDSTSGGAGLNAFGSGVYTFVNTALQNNVATGSAASANCGCSGSSCKTGVMVSQGHNLSSDGTCFLSTSAADLPNTDAQLQALAGNGGPTETMALLIHTPAVDAGDNANCPNNDQRGNLRPADGNLGGHQTCDIGAYELFTPANDLHASGNRAQNRVRRGSPANASFDFTNDPTASADATGVMITTDPLPASYSLTGSTWSTSGSTTNCPFDAQTRVVSCDVGTLARGQTATLDLQGSGTQAGRLDITAHVSATAPADLFPDNNTSTVTMIIQGESNLAVTAAGPGQNPTVNGSASVTFTVKNLGPDDANNVKLLALFQNRMRYQNMSMSNGGTCTLSGDGANSACNLGSIPAGQSVTGTLNLQPTSVGDATVDLQVSTDDVDPDNSNDSVSVPLTVAAELPPPTPTTTSSSGGGGGCVSKPGGPFDPALLVLVLAGGAGLLSRRWRAAAKNSRS